MFQKLSYLTETSTKIPDSERELAERAVFAFKDVINAIKIAEENIEIIQNAFDNEEEVSEELLHKKRGLFYRYKKKVRQNYSKVKIKSFYALKQLSYFSSDYNIDELSNSFKEKVISLEEKVVEMLDNLDNYKSTTFKEDLLASLESIKNEGEELDDLIQDRIIKRINVNILGKDWVVEIGGKLNLTIEEKVPLVVQLFKERQKALDGDVGSIATKIETQKQNPADAEKISFPSTTKEIA